MNENYHQILTDLLHSNSNLASLSKKQIHGWVDKAITTILQNHGDSAKTICFQLEELARYVTRDEIKAMQVPLHKETEIMKQLYRQKHSVMSCHVMSSKWHEKLQSPEETFGAMLHARPCPKCGKTDTTSMAIQDRSADEATSYHHECLNPLCKHSWRDRG